MKYVKQFGNILGVTCIAEFIKFFIPLPIPASIYGLVIMLGLLMTKVVKLEMVNETAHFLLEIMPMMFIPAAVGLIAVFDTLKSMLVPAITITLFSTIVVMASAGRVTEFILERKKHE